MILNDPTLTAEKISIKINKTKITAERYHHEIYLSDPRKCDNNKLKTVIRHPMKKN